MAEVSIAARLTELSPGAQAAYAQLLDAAAAAAHHRSVADLKGSFAAKIVKGRRYWYYQYTEPSGKLRQLFVGPDDDAVAKLRAQKDLPGAAARLGPLARAAAALGCTHIVPVHARVLQRLAEYGFFRAGGVLVGTHAFLAFGNMLGVRWASAERTQDVDFAHAGKSLSVALPADLAIDTDRAIDSLGMGFLPIQAGAGGTYLNPRDPQFRLDFLTPLHRGGDKPFRHPTLGVNLQPLPFMEYSLIDIQHTALFSGEVVILANVPSPARYALHKLIVVGERKGAYAAKSAKDLDQAGMLLTRLGEFRRSEVDEAWRDLIGRGKGWRTRARQGVAALHRRFPELGVRDWLTG
jgi:hypothetical protein